MKKMKRFLSLLICMVMLMSFLPMSASAADYWPPFIPPQPPQQPQTYTVTFNGNGHGGNTIPAPQTVDAGAKANEPADPSDADYNFVEWCTRWRPYKKADWVYTAFDFGTPIDDDITLYARWQEKTKHTVSFNIRQWDEDPSSVRVEDGKPVSAPVVEERAGYRLDGWYTNRNCTGEKYDFSKPVTGGFTLYAKWRYIPAEYAVTYNANGENVSKMPENQTKVEDTPLTLSSAKPERTGYEFTGWNTNADGSGTNYAAGASYTENAPLTLYAKWRYIPAEYAVTYNANGENVSKMPENQTKVENTSLTLSSAKPERTGYEFTGWNTNADGSGTNYAAGASYTENAPLTLYAKWRYIPAEYAVTYNANGENVSKMPKNQTKVENTPLTLSSAKPERTGYEFTGWNTNADGSGKDYAAGASYTENAPLTLYAKWRYIPAEYAVTYNANGENVSKMPKNQTKVENTPLTLSSAEPERTGYTFTGWNTKTDGSGKDYAAGESYTENAPLTLYAKWTKNGPVEHTVTFHANRNGVTDPKAKTVAEGGTVTQPEVDKVTEYEGYFPVTYPVTYAVSGWYTDNQLQNKFDFENDTITKDTHLYAKWEKIHTVRFIGPNGQVVKTKEVFDGRTVSAEGVEVEGYQTPNQWHTRDFLGNKYPYDFDLKVSWSFDLYADWTPVAPTKYTVTFNRNGHGTAPAAQEVVEGEKVTKPADLSEDGYSFGGWYTEDTCQNAYDFDKKVNGGFTLFAKWTPVNYNITYMDEDKELNLEPKSYTIEDESFELPEPEKDGFSFAGWIRTDVDEKPMEAVVTKGSTGNRTYKATWTKDYYTVVFHGNDGILPTRSATITQRIGVGEKAPLMANPFVREGYEFTDWNTKADGSGDSHEAGKPVENDLAKKGESIDLYAQWNAKTYTVTFMDGEKELDKMDVKFGEEIPVIDDPEKDGYTFDGWAEEIPEAMPANNLVFNAKWTQKSYTVKFDTDGKCTAPADQTVLHGEEATKPTDPEAAGYTFGGWYADEACTIAYVFGSPVNGPTTLYAKWTEVVVPVTYFKVTYDANKGTGEMPVVSVEAGEGHTLLANEFKAPSGKVFKCWKIGNKELKPGEKIEVKGDVTVKAVWKNKTASSDLDYVPAAGDNFPTLLWAGLLLFSVVALVEVVVLRRKRS